MDRHLASGVLSHTQDGCLLQTKSMELSLPKKKKDILSNIYGSDKKNILRTQSILHQSTGLGSNVYIVHVPVT